MKPDKKKTEDKRGKNNEIRLRNPIHPDNKHDGKGAKESREFHANCEFNIKSKK